MSTSPSTPPDHDPIAPNEMGGLGQNKIDLQVSHLSSRQILALPILAASPNMQQAARDAGIGQSTLYRWLRDENFCQELKRLTVEVAELTRSELRGLTLRSLKVLADLMENPDPMVRLRAARTIASMGIRITDTLRKDIQALEETSPSGPTGPTTIQ